MGAADVERAVRHDEFHGTIFNRGSSTRHRGRSPTSTVPPRQRRSGRIRSSPITSSPRHPAMPTARCRTRRTRTPGISRDGRKRRNSEPVATVVLTDYAWPDTDIERGVIEAAGHRLVAGPATPGSAEDIAALVAAHDPAAIMTCWAEVSAAAITARGDLRIVQRIGVGLDNIAVAAATARGAWVANVPDYCVGEVADHAVALLLDWARAPSRSTARSRRRVEPRRRTAAAGRRPDRRDRRRGANRPRDGGSARGVRLPGRAPQPVILRRCRSTRCLRRATRSSSICR